MLLNSCTCAVHVLIEVTGIPAYMYMYMLMHIRGVCLIHNSVSRSQNILTRWEIFLFHRKVNSWVVTLDVVKQRRILRFVGFSCCFEDFCDVASVNWGQPLGDDWNQRNLCPKISTIMSLLKHFYVIKRYWVIFPDWDHENIYLGIFCKQLRPNRNFKLIGWTQPFDVQFPGVSV